MNTKPLISSVRAQVLGAHAHIGVWTRGAKAGELCVDAADARAVIARLADCPLEAVEPLPADGSIVHVVVEETPS